MIPLWHLQAMSTPGFWVNLGQNFPPLQSLLPKSENRIVPKTINEPFSFTWNTVIFNNTFRFLVRAPRQQETSLYSSEVEVGKICAGFFPRIEKNSRMSTKSQMFEKLDICDESSKLLFSRVRFSYSKQISLHCIGEDTATSSTLDIKS